MRDLFPRSPSKLFFGKKIPSGISQYQDLLIEIGTEELPPHSLQNLVHAFADSLDEQLTKANFSHKAIEEFASSRRLAVIIHAVADMQTEQVIERRGPLLSKAYDDDKQPTSLGLGFAKSCGVDITQLSTVPSEKGDCLFFSRTEPGQPLTALLPGIIESVLSTLPINKPMRWGNNTLEFARPIRWITLLHGNKTINASIFDIKTSAITYGHRFHHPEPIVLKNTAEYIHKLLTPGHVVSDFAKRREQIHQQIITLIETQDKAKTIKAVIDQALLDELTGMVEYPMALLGQFSPNFLELPKEILISVMKSHQKCFSVENNQGELLPYFVIISNIKSKSRNRVIKDNECVMHARLNDSSFFYNTDKKISLNHQLEKLEHVLFQNKLGSLFDKSKRIENLAGLLATQINIDSLLIKRAALFAKTDLVTDMVGEFPELSGTMGYYYAKNEGESESVAQAIKEHYFPRFGGDQLPQTDMGGLISIADRLDTLVGLFGIEQAPTGDKDPFALRRAALGLLRIIIEKKYDFDLDPLIDSAISGYNIAFALEKNDLKKQILNFILERLRAWYVEQGIRPDVFSAVYACYPTKPLDFEKRIQAVNIFVQSSAAKSLAAANKRVSNILKKQGDVLVSLAAPDVNLLSEDAEINLERILSQKILEVEPLYKAGNYSDGLKALTSLQESIDSFFNDVMVMVDDKKVRDNRLALLNQLYRLFSQVADVSLLQGE